MSEQAKFTPGPWKALSGGPYVVKSNSDPNGSCGDSVVCVTANTASHVRFAADVGSLEDKANARLIAAAPELLSALRHALEDLEQLNVGHASIEDVCGIIPEIRNVLNKATGN